MPDGSWALRLAAALTLTLANPAVASDAPDDPGQLALARIEDRARRLDQVGREMEAATRRRAKEAYRLAQRRELAFVGAPAQRLEQAQAADLALLAYARAATEARAVRDELTRTREDGKALTAARERPGAGAPERGPAQAGTPLVLERPCRGPIVGQPGLRGDPGTEGSLRLETVELLARMNEPVAAPAEGIVRRVEALPQGGFAVVTEHAGGWVTILSGLRDIAVLPGQRVAARATLGLAGRNLDGAPILSLELARGRSSVDPRPYLRNEPTRASRSRSRR